MRDLPSQSALPGGDALNKVPPSVCGRVDGRDYVPKLSVGQGAWPRSHLSCEPVLGSSAEYERNCLILYPVVSLRFGDPSSRWLHLEPQLERLKRFDGTDTSPYFGVKNNPSKQLDCQTQYDIQKQGLYFQSRFEEIFSRVEFVHARRLSSHLSAPRTSALGSQAVISARAIGWYRFVSPRSSEDYGYES
ncbi:hypothetical protein PCANC_24402 [Puccinia coronata f. sp. avenae]|uniref:Uncharacterized protein n=1 Tax=Puccinia coronata f. sp. avenae TaxID=200324 RepID=A0A2N5SAF4_9BASI|nr:hypothetical protein PCANC_24402 [Puccinia coronata f. sp. avenae]